MAEFRRENCVRIPILLLLVLLVAAPSCAHSSSHYGSALFKLHPLHSQGLCKACSKCTDNPCPDSSEYPHMTAYDGSLIAGPLQSDYVSQNDRGVYAVEDVKGGLGNLNAYYGWKSTTGSSSGYHRFENYMDKCTKKSLLMAYTDGKVGVDGLTVSNVESAEWKRIAVPKSVNHRGFQFYMSRSTGLCLTISEKLGSKRPLVVEKCKFDGSNTRQLFAFRFHYKRAFCCCNVHNS